MSLSIDKMAQCFEEQKERHIAAKQVANIFSDINRFKVTHVDCNSESDTVLIGILDTRTGCGLAVNLYGLVGFAHDEPENEHGLHYRFGLEVLTVGRKGNLSESFNELFDPRDFDKK